MAGNPSLSGDDPEKKESYRRCMNNENCIVHTIVAYTGAFDNAVSNLVPNRKFYI